MDPPPPPPQLRVLDTVQLLASPPHPHGELESPLAPLSGLDADPNVLGVTFRSVRFFPPHPVSLDPLHALQRAFAAALAFFPQLAGSIRVLDRAVVVVFSGADAVPLVLAASDDLSVAEAVDADAPDSPLLDLLAPADDEGVAAGTGPALALQATRFACGGVALGMRVAHALCDGAGATRFLAAAARFARGEPVAPPVWARRELLGPRNPPRVVTPSFDTVLAPYEDDDVHGHEQQQKLLKVCFHASDARVETLRARLAAEAAGVRLTTFEVLAAFIWRARVKANGTSPNETVKMVLHEHQQAPRPAAAGGVLGQRVRTSLRLPHRRRPPRPAAGGDGVSGQEEQAGGGRRVRALLRRLPGAPPPRGGHGRARRRERVHGLAAAGPRGGGLRVGRPGRRAAAVVADPRERGAVLPGAVRRHGREAAAWVQGVRRGEGDGRGAV